jgi:glycerophosphoryl diester phosphodiesterase
LQNIWNPKTGQLINKTPYEIATKKELWTGYTSLDTYPLSKTYKTYIVNSNIYNAYGLSGKYFPCPFSEYLDICKKYNKESVIELKDENISSLTNLPAKAKQIAELLIKNLINYLKLKDVYKTTTIIAFDDALHDNKEYFYNSLVKYDTEKVLVNKYEKLCWNCELNHHNPTADAYKALLQGKNIDIDYTYLTQDLLNLAKEKGKIVNVWTVNDFDKIEQLRKMGVNQITTNIYKN